MQLATLAALLLALAGVSAAPALESRHVSALPALAPRQSSDSSYWGSGSGGSGSGAADTAAIKASESASSSAGGLTRVDAGQYTDAAKWSQGAYCNPAVGKTVNGAQITWAAGTGGKVPHVYVAYSPSQNTIVVAHEGTEPLRLTSDLNDIEFALTGAQAGLAGCLASGAQLHYGFQNTWAQTAAGVLGAVQALRAQHPAARVLLTGHSLGAALSAIESVYLACNGIPADTVVFGQPRVGNPAFAQQVALTHIVNYADPVPHLPPEAWGFQHSAGEVWIDGANSDNFFACPGVENADCADSISWTDYNLADHIGVYAGVGMGQLASCNV